MPQVVVPRFGSGGQPGHGLPRTSARHTHIITKRQSLRFQGIDSRTRQVAWAEEAVTLKDYGTARQITRFDAGEPALQILASDEDACPAETVSWLKSRWREENFLKYASQNDGIDAICDYIASVETNTMVIGNPARKAAVTAVRRAD